MKAATVFVFGDPIGDYISIHAAREGGDSTSRIRRCTVIIFQSTPPVKAATNSERERKIWYFISIHAAREGGDWECPD